MRICDRYAGDRERLGKGLMRLVCKRMTKGAGGIFILCVCGCLYEVPNLYSHRCRIHFSYVSNNDSKLCRVMALRSFNYPSVSFDDYNRQGEITLQGIKFFFESMRSGSRVTSILP